MREKNNGEGRGGMKKEKKFAASGKGAHALCSGGAAFGHSRVKVLKKKKTAPRGGGEKGGVRLGILCCLQPKKKKWFDPRGGEGETRSKGKTHPTKRWGKEKGRRTAWWGFDVLSRKRGIEAQQKRGGSQEEKAALLIKKRRDWPKKTLSL